MQKGLRVITLQGAIEKSPILLSQYWKNVLYLYLLYKDNEPISFHHEGYIIFYSLLPEIIFNLNLKLSIPFPLDIIGGKKNEIEHLFR